MRRSRAFPIPSRSCSKTCCAPKTAHRQAVRHRVRRRSGRSARPPRRLTSARRACCCRISPACPAWSIWPPCATRCATMGADPKRANPLIPADLVIDHSVQVDRVRHHRRIRLQCAARISAQSGALRVPALGPESVSEFPRGAARHRHRASGESRISGAAWSSRDQKQSPRARVSRHAGRHRFAHHHDQRPGRGRLGRGRHRSRGLHARPAHFDAAARSGRVQAARAGCRKAAPRPTWCSPSRRCCARRAWSASSSSSTAPGVAALPLADRATIGNMAPEYGATIGFFPIDRPDARLSAAYQSLRRN